jgi:hypothetical protein
MSVLHRRLDGRTDFEQMRNFLKLISACANDILSAMDEIERLAARAEERDGPPAALVIMPSRRSNRKEAVQ